MVEMTVQQIEGIPDGVYPAIFLGVEETTTQYGQAYRWKFELANDENCGRHVNRMTGVRNNDRTNCGKTALDLMGSLTGNTADYEGAEYQLKLSMQDNGFSKIDALWPSKPHPTKKAGPKKGSHDVSFDGQAVDDILGGDK